MESRPAPLQGRGRRRGPPVVGWEPDPRPGSEGHPVLSIGPAAGAAQRSCAQRGLRVGDEGRRGRVRRGPGGDPPGQGPSGPLLHGATPRLRGASPQRGEDWEPVRPKDRGSQASSATSQPRAGGPRGCRRGGTQGSPAGTGQSGPLDPHLGIGSGQGGARGGPGAFSSGRMGTRRAGKWGVRGAAFPNSERNLQGKFLSRGCAGSRRGTGWWPSGWRRSGGPLQRAASASGRRIGCRHGWFRAATGSAGRGDGPPLVIPSTRSPENPPYQCSPGQEHPSSRPEARIGPRCRLFRHLSVPGLGREGGRHTVHLGRPLAEAGQAALSFFFSPGPSSPSGGAPPWPGH